MIVISRVGIGSTVGISGQDPIPNPHHPNKPGVVATIEIAFGDVDQHPTADEFVKTLKSELAVVDEAIVAAVQSHLKLADTFKDSATSGGAAKPSPAPSKGQR